MLRSSAAIYCCTALLCCTASIASLSLVHAQGFLNPAAESKRKQFTQVSGRKAKDFRQREGSKLVEVVGRFQLSGDRALFLPTDAADGSSYRVLENLALERVLDNLNESRTERLWIVSGVLTEFRNANHLLLTKAVIQTQHAIEPAP